MKKLNDNKEVIYICVCHSFTFSTYALYEQHCKAHIMKVMEEVEDDAKAVIKNG